MVFQWYLFVLLFVVAIFASMTGQTYMVNSFGQREKRYGWLPFFIITVPMVYWAGTRKSMNFGDTSAYIAGFQNSPFSWSGLRSVLSEDVKDKGFTVFTALIKSIIGNRDVVYLTIIAAICLLCVMGTYKKYSCNFIISVFLFVASADYLQWTYNGIRQFIPVSIIFACTGLMLRKRYVPLIIIILILSTIHASALIMLPMIFVVQGKPWNKRTVLFIAAIIVSILFVDQFTGLITNVMENTQYSGEVDQFLSTEGTSIQRVLVFSVPAVLSLIFKSRIEKADNKLIYLATNMAVVSFFCYLLSAFTSGLFLGRIPIYFSLYNYILLPWEIEYIFNKKSAQMICFVMIVFYMAFYYYQVDITWGL